MKSGSSYSTHKCPHCGKFHSSNAGPSNPGGTGSAEEGKEPGGSDGGEYDMEPNGGNDDDNLPQESKEEEAKEVATRAQDPVTRARRAVKAKLKAFDKRDGKY